MAQIIIPESYRKWDSEDIPSVTRPQKRSARLLQEAEQGNVKAQSELGWMYYKGEDILQDYNSSLYWFRKAAEAGDAEAQYGLGLQYYHYQGVDMDLDEAAKWLRRAVRQGNEAAREELGHLLLDHLFLAEDEAEWLWAKKWGEDYIDRYKAEYRTKLGLQ